MSSQRCAAESRFRLASSSRDSSRRLALLARDAGGLPLPPPAAPEQPAMAGALGKRGSAVPYSWRRRHFCLRRGGRVRYYGSEQAAAARPSDLSAAAASWRLF